MLRCHMELLTNPDGRRKGDEGYQPQPDLGRFAQPRLFVVAQQEQEQQGTQHRPDDKDKIGFHGKGILEQVRAE